MGREGFNEMRQHFIYTRKHGAFSRRVSDPLINRTSVCVKIRV